MINFIDNCKNLLKISMGVFYFQESEAGRETHAEKPKSSRELIEAIMSDGRLDGDDLEEYESLQELLNSDIESLSDEMKSKLTLSYKESLSKGYTVSNENDFLLLKKIGEKYFDIKGIPDDYKSYVTKFGTNEKSFYYDEKSNQFEHEGILSISFNNNEISLTGDETEKLYNRRQQRRSSIYLKPEIPQAEFVEESEIPQAEFVEETEPEQEKEIKQADPEQSETPQTKPLEQTEIPQAEFVEENGNDSSEKITEKSTTTYEVKKGDTLWAIVSGKYNLTSKSDIAKTINYIVDMQDSGKMATRLGKDTDPSEFRDGIKGDKLWVGDILKLPNELPDGLSEMSLDRKTTESTNDKLESNSELSQEVNISENLETESVINFDGSVTSYSEYTRYLGPDKKIKREVVVLTREGNGVKTKLTMNKSDFEDVNSRKEKLALLEEKYNEKLSKHKTEIKEQEQEEAKFILEKYDDGSVLRYREINKKVGPDGKINRSYVLLTREGENIEETLQITNDDFNDESVRAEKIKILSEKYYNSVNEEKGKTRLKESKEEHTELKTELKKYLKDFSLSLSDLLDNNQFKDDTDKVGAWLSEFEEGKVVLDYKDFDENNTLTFSFDNNGRDKKYNKGHQIYIEFTEHGKVNEEHFKTELFAKIKKSITDK